MKKEKIQGVIDLYRKKFELMKIPNKEANHSLKYTTGSDVLGKLPHCHQMLDKMEFFIKENRLEKAQRWLGFIQGVLWDEGVYSLDDLKHHSMTGGEESPK